MVVLEGKWVVTYGEKNISIFAIIINKENGEENLQFVKNLSVDSSIVSGIHFLHLLLLLLLL
jgi:hypothetical protein